MKLEKSRKKLIKLINDFEDYKFFFIRKGK